MHTDSERKSTRGPAKERAARSRQPGMRDFEATNLRSASSQRDATRTPALARRAGVGISVRDLYSRVFFIGRFERDKSLSPLLSQPREITRARTTVTVKVSENFAYITRLAV